MPHRFPAGFRWGVSTSAYQIEGSVSTDGRGQSIWDEFAGQTGRIRDGHTAEIACDHYRRWPEDVALAKRLGIDTYRFSIAWPRVIPSGRGPVNAAGLDFYERLVDGLLQAGIHPLPTLYHWDLPQALEDEGGWLNRDTASGFADYCAAVVARLGDRVTEWITLNEPFEHMSLGYALGVHAPGRQLLLDALPVAHHQLLGHGWAVERLRAAGVETILLANSYSPVIPADADAGHAAQAYDTLQRRLFTDPVLLGRYPDLEIFGISDLPFVGDDDLDVISRPIDGLGVNYYHPTRIAAAEPDAALPFALVDIPGAPTTDFGWPIVPDGLRRTLVDLTEEYGTALPRLWITENGCSYATGPDAEGRIADTDRISYMESHLAALGEAIAAGADVGGYCAWSLLDNFEWAEGYHQRFGLVHVDFSTQQRTPKDSFAWYADFIATQRQ